MKKILILLAAIVLLSSCAKDFLDKKAVGSLTIEEFFKNENDATIAVTSAYGEVKCPRLAQVDFILGDALTSDYFIGGSQDDVGRFEPFVEFNIPTTNKYSDYMWVHAYSGVNKTNQAITGISSMTEEQISAVLKKQYLGELYFLRAYYYWNLVRMFGDVPLLIRVPTEDDIHMSRSPKAEVYAQIEKDLADATGMLPEQAGTDYGRVTRGAAKALAMRVNLYQGDFADVKAIGEDFMATESYSLDVIENVFTMEHEFGSGSIFEINFWGQGEASTSAWTNNGNFRTPFMMPRGITFGWGLDLPTQAMYDAYEEGDLRRNAFIIATSEVIEIWAPATLSNEWQAYQDAKIVYDANPSADNKTTMDDAYDKIAKKIDGHEATGYYNRKFFLTPDQDPGDWSKSGDNTRVLRFADVCLMLSEARVHEGGDAAEYFNLVRTRAGVAPIASPTLNDIYKERRLELSGEGHGFWDLIRTDRAATEIPNFKVGVNEVFPIPQSEVDLSNGNIKQNNGYTAG